MKTLIDVLAALSDFVKVASEWAESASKAEVETFTQIYPQKEEAVKKHLNDTTSISVEINNEIVYCHCPQCGAAETLTFSAVPFTAMSAH